MDIKTNLFFVSENRRGLFFLIHYRRKKQVYAEQNKMKHDMKHEKI